MNILTKICVVVLVVVNLFASAVFIGFANNNENWKQKFEDTDQRLQAATLEANNQLAHASMLQTERAALQTQYIADKSRDQQIITALGVDKGKLEASHAAQETYRQGILTQLSGLRADIQAMEVARAALESSLARSNDDKAAIQKELVELQAKLAQGEADLRRQAGTIEVLKRDNANLREQNERQAEQLAKGGGSSDGTSVSGGHAVAPANIKGQVTAVQGDAVSINVGSAKGVREGMIMIIHRKEQLVGYLRIGEVEVNEAAGVIEEKQADPQQGDGVFQKDV